MSHIDVKLSCSKTDHYCPDGSIEIALQTFVREKKIFLQVLGLEKLQLGDCSIGITPQLHFYRDQKRKCVQGPKSLVTNQTRGYHLRTFANQGKEQRRALTESATESVLPASTAAHSTVSSLSSLQASFETSPLTTLSLTAPPLEEKCPEGRGQRKEVADWWWLVLN